MAQSYNIINGSGITISWSTGVVNYVTYLNTLNVIDSTSDWINNGGGKFTYVGTSPRLFIFSWTLEQASASYGGSTYWNGSIYFIKNASQARIAICKNFAVMTGTGPRQISESSTGSLTEIGEVFSPGDYFYVMIGASTTIVSSSGTAYGVGFTVSMTTY